MAADKEIKDLLKATIHLVCQMAEATADLMLDQSESEKMTPQGKQETISHSYKLREMAKQVSERAQSIL